MVVLDSFEVSVIVDGESAQEYDDDEVEAEFKAKYPTSVSKYVEAVSGAFFAFRVCIKKDYVAGEENTISARIYVDGKPSVRQIISIKKRHGSSRQGIRSQAIRTVSNSPGMSGGKPILLNLQFADLELSILPCGTRAWQ
jgi:hypothetical protein